MMELEFGGERTPIPPGELVIGAGLTVGLRLTGVAATHAVVIGEPDGSASVRRVGDNDVLLNGVRLGTDPAPILHGDKIQVGIHELLVHDPRRSGSTHFVSAADVAKMVGAVKSSAPKAPTAATGGRLVCLTDGREYTISSAPLVIGREAGCDIVVPNKDVSRRHAEIFVSPQGYVLVDSSTNGTFVNGDRIEAQRVLSRADVIKIGDHEFRFYADKAVEMVSQALSTSTPGMPIVPPPPSGAAERLSPTMHGAPAASAPGAKPSSWSAGAAAQMATFLVRSGLLKGQRLTVRVPVVNIGRGDYNDLVIPDDSVSGSHAKLQRREGVWILVDNESTNGTWVDGERIQGEVALGPGTVIRFGEISVLFEPTDDHLGTEGGSGTKVMGAVRPQIPVPAEPAAPVPAHAEPRRERAAEASPVIAPPRRPPVVMTSPPSRRLPGWVIPTALIVLLGVVAAILLLR